jgi:hypothetical protein
MQRTPTLSLVLHRRPTATDDVTPAAEAQLHVVITHTYNH